MARHTFSVVPSRLKSTGLSWTAAARNLVGFIGASERPGVQDEGVVALVEEHDVEHVEGVDRPDTRQERRLTVAVERLEREAARIDLSAFGHERPYLLIDHQMTGECLRSNLGKPPLDAEKHARPIEEDARIEALAHQARGLKHVDQADRPFEGHRVEGHERLFARLGFDVFEDLFLVVDEEISLFVRRCRDSRHGWLLSRAFALHYARPGPAEALERGADERCPACFSVVTTVYSVSTKRSYEGM